MTLDPTKLAGVRSAAEKATPGPYEVSPARTVDNEFMVCAGEGHGYGLVAVVLTEVDAAFIAAANPATVIEMCDAIERLSALPGHWQAGVRETVAKRLAKLAEQYGGYGFDAATQGARSYGVVHHSAGYVLRAVDDILAAISSATLTERDKSRDEQLLQAQSEAARWRERAETAEAALKRMVFRSQDIREVCRQWEPDHASPESLRLIFFAREAEEASLRVLTGRLYSEPGPVELRMDQDRLAALSTQTQGGGEHG